MNPTRRHDIDALRVLLFVTLIVYHCAMLYVADWSFHLKSGTQYAWLQVPMLLLNRWRMPLLFVISGVALGFLRSDATGWRFAANRSRRILAPLVFGIAVVVPIQPYCEGVSRHLVDPGFGRFLVHYWTLRPWPADAFTGSRYGITWNHLWYLAYLWVYCLLLAALMPLFAARPGRAVRRVIAGLRGGWLLLAPALPKAVALVTLGDAFPATGDLVHDWAQHVVYFGYFVFGWCIATDAGLWRELAARRAQTLRLALVAFVAYATIVQALLPEDVSGWMLQATRSLSALNTWFWVATVLGWSVTLLDRPFRWLPYATEAVLPWYVLHQSILIAVAAVVIPLRVGAGVEFLVILGSTFAGCALLHEFAIRRSAVLRMLFGLKPASVAKRTRPSVVVAA